jgi:hypothetical protein
MRDMPETRRADVVEMLHGRSIADPYRRLEHDPGDWIDRQNAATELYVSALPRRSYFAGRLCEIFARPSTGGPVFRRGRYVFEYDDGALPQNDLCAAASPDIDPRVTVGFADDETAIDSAATLHPIEYYAAPNRAAGFHTS